MTMRSSFGNLHDAPAAAPAVRPVTAPAPAAKEIPYDHVAVFQLLGQSGNRVQDVINVSIDGAFVAVSIGYSFVPSSLELTVPRSGASASPADALAEMLLAIARDEPSLVQSILVRLCGIEFKYTVVDSGSGRELQNRPIHNIAGLGESTGDRPFRPLAKPMMFAPRSTIRIEVEEISEGTLYEGAQLFIVLHGYKILGYGTQR
jgi:hypothetical protein